MSGINPTKKQHYLPQFYLKSFAGSNGLLYFYDKKTDRISSPKHYSSVGYKDYFYAAETGVPDEISQQIEKWLQVYEDIISKELIKIIQKILGVEQIDHNDKYILASLMCMLWLRTPSMRHSLNQSRLDLRKEMLKFGDTATFNPTNNVHHLRFMTETFGFNDKGFTNMFYGQKWKIYINKGRRKFLTAENPVVEWWLPPKGFWDNASFLQRTKFFPLTPDIFIVLSDPKGSSKVNRKTLFNADEELVKEFNVMLASRKNDFIYSSDKSLLEDFASSRSKPGALESKIYMKYDYPWDEFRKKQSK